MPEPDSPDVAPSPPSDARLPSWRTGPTRDALVAFLDAARSVPVHHRVAAFDNDGTLWCERPRYIQYEYFVDALRRRARDEPDVAQRAEYAAVLGGDRAALAEFGLARLALALGELFEGLTPDEYAADATSFVTGALHPDLGRPFAATTYRPMLELIAELRRLEFTVAIATGGGTEFVRAVSADLYGVPPELVVGTLITHELDRDGDDRLRLRRTARLLGDANEGPAKVTNIQTQLGRQPILAAGNTVGDRELLDWTATHDGPHLALLVDHDDSKREYAYTGRAATVADTEPLADLAARNGWTVVSMADDWATVFDA